MKLFIQTIFLVCFTLMASVGWPDEIASDEQKIRTLMLRTWDKPDAPLEINPLVISSDYAIASWTQGHHGGRALLAKHEQGWQVLLCSGDGLKEITTLQQSGIPADTATQLVKFLNNAEAKLPEETRKKFSVFGKEQSANNASHGIVRRP